MRFETWILTQPKELQENLNRFVAHNNSLTKGHNGAMHCSADYTGDLRLYHVRVDAFEEECRKRNVLASYPLPNNSLGNRWAANPAGLQWNESTGIPNEDDNGL